MGYLHKIIELEKQKNFQEIGTTLFMEAEISYNHTEWGEKKPNMKYWEFVSKTKHLLNKDFHKNIMFGDLQPNPYLINAYKMIGGKGEIAFWREDKYPLDGAIARLMFTPTIYIYAKECCEVFEEKIGNKPLFMSGLTPQGVVNKYNSEKNTLKSPTNYTNNSSQSGCMGVLLLIMGIISLLILQINS
jgi:hypothetical protein